MSQAAATLAHVAEVMRDCPRDLVLRVQAFQLAQLAGMPSFTAAAAAGIPLTRDDSPASMRREPVAMLDQVAEAFAGIPPHLLARIQVLSVAVAGGMAPQDAAVATGLSGVVEVLSNDEVRIDLGGLGQEDLAGMLPAGRA